MVRIGGFRGYLEGGTGNTIYRNYLSAGNHFGLAYAAAKQYFQITPY
jgi:hypothetical protein